MFIFCMLFDFLHKDTLLKSSIFVQSSESKIFLKPTNQIFFLICHV